MSTNEYHTFRGAVQSLIICLYLKNQSIDSIYYNWLIDNQNRIDERLIFYCNEIWDCEETYYSTSTSYTFNNGVDFEEIWGNYEGSGCLLLFRECFVDWTSRQFPQTWYGGTYSSFNFGFGSSSESVYFYNVKANFLYDWLSNKGLDNDFFLELYKCVGYLESPFGGSADEYIEKSCLESVMFSEIDTLTGNSEATSTIDSLVDFALSKTDIGDALFYIEKIYDLKLIDEEIRWDRSMELYDLLESDSDILTKCGNPPADISDWENLASFVPSQSVLNRLEELGEGWRLQGLLTPTAAPSINLDYFSTTITQMPENPQTNEPWEPDELFSHIRKNINDFVDNSNSTFNPISGDDSLWLSDAPVPAVISININVPNFPLGDDGSVICAQSDTCCWIFSTVTAPQFPLDSDGTHPVSGNRQFGYIIHPNGDMEIYTKGVDRYFYPTANFPNQNPAGKLAAYLIEKIAFSGGDDLWESFQNGIYDYVTDSTNQGSAQINQPIKLRPKTKNALITLLKQGFPINYVPCSE